MERLSSVQSRLATWGEEVAEHFQAKREFGNYQGRPDLGHVESGAVVTVDSFYSTINTEADSLYWTLNEVAVQAEPGPCPGYVTFYLSTNTPNLTGIFARTNETNWQRVPFIWTAPLHQGQNQFRFRSCNTIGIMGRVTEVAINYVLGSNELNVTTNGGMPVMSPHQFLYEDYVHPELTSLRQAYRLDEKLATTGADWERLIPLRTWLKGLWIHGQPLRLPPWNARFIIERGMKGIERFHCVHYSVSFVQCCLSLGYVVRMVNLHRGIAEDCEPGKEQQHEPPCDEHVVTEIWSNDLGKWVLFDVDYDCHYVHDGVVLNCLEIKNLLQAGRASEIKMCSGPHTALEMGDQTLAKRLSFYRHLSFLMRNNFLTDPEGPIRVAHLTDDQTPPILWWYGEDMMWRRNIMGPVHVAKPYKQTTSVLNDGRLHTAWASDDAPTQHWAKVEWEKPVDVSCVVIHWADRVGVFRTSSQYRIEVLLDSGWETVVKVDKNREQPWNVHEFPMVSTTGVRVVQSLGGGHPLHPNRMWLRQIQVF
ncbi:MAG: discoidin domain-containing protein [Firmicutes bacterium]|nr:discoidin domain-containing protein [Bacillota bacterium]